MTRATMSVGPPAENDTMMRTGFDGYLSSAFASAPTSAHASTTAPRAAINRSRLPMTSLPDFMTTVVRISSTANGKLGTASLNPDARGFDHFAPFRDFRPDVGGVILGCIDDGLEAECCQALLDF